MVRFISGFVCGLMGVAVFGLSMPEAGSTSRAFDAISASVNRAAKGDRLSLEGTRSPQASKMPFNTSAKTRSVNEGRPVLKTTPQQTKRSKMPIGCEPAVSVVLDNDLAKTPSRCLAGHLTVVPSIG